MQMHGVFQQLGLHRSAILEEVILYSPIALPGCAGLDGARPAQEMETNLKPVILVIPGALPTQLVVPAPPTRASRVQSEWFPKKAGL
ncbi:MAG: hypothetical protein L0Y57_11650 [Beijerinckiaceae bacterium]|nr:hypothetical protein [Beijerinckiaceae bacterium]MCI0735239.1 hypothetical protein [Beijerinckiaceae bacterium]